MKIRTKATEEWRVVPQEEEEGLEGGLRKYVWYKGDIPCKKKVQYRDPAGKSYKNLSEVPKQFKKPKSKEKESKKEKKRKSNINHRAETAGDLEEEVSPSKRRNKEGELSHSSTNLVCRGCLKVFRDLTSFSHHQDSCFSKIKIKTPKKPLAKVTNIEFQCDDCDFIAESKNQLKKHKKNEHKQKKGKKITSPAPSVPRSQGPPGPVIEKEEKDEGDLFCEECGVDVQSRSQLEAHMRTVHQMTGKRRKEKVPPPVVSTPRPRDLQPRGVQQAHGGPESLIAELGLEDKMEEMEEMEVPGLYCEECGVEYKRRSQLAAHMRSSHQMSLAPSLPDFPIKKGNPIMDYEEDSYDEEEGEYDEEEEEEFYGDDEEFDPDVVEVEDVSSSPWKENNSIKQIIRYDSSDEDSDDFLDEEEEPEEITLDGDDEDDDIIIEDFKGNEEEEDRKKVVKFESYIDNADRVAEMMEEPRLLQQFCATAWWTQPAKWKPSNTWEVWNAKVPQVCAHYKIKDIKISKDVTFSSYDDFDRSISAQLSEINPYKSFKILYTWKKAKWFSLLDPVIPENMKIVEETLEDDE